MENVARRREFRHDGGNKKTTCHYPPYRQLCAEKHEACAHFPPTLYPTPLLSALGACLMPTSAGHGAQPLGNFHLASVSHTPAEEGASFGWLPSSTIEKVDDHFTRFTFIDATSYMFKGACPLLPRVTATASRYGAPFPASCMCWCPRTRKPLSCLLQMWLKRGWNAVVGVLKRRKNDNDSGSASTKPSFWSKLGKPKIEPSQQTPTCEGRMAGS